jgi:hypothetical protein
MSTDIKKEALERWDLLEKLQKEYDSFEPFLIDAMEDLMGFQCSDVQIDIGAYLQYGPQYLMVQAQRSQAKSTIVAIYAVWCLIHDPKYRVLVISAGADVAMEIANWIIQIIMNWDILECLRPDRQHGDRASAKAFDVNYQLKGAEKSPSVACIGITANMQGRRADLLVPDDIESSKNGTTEIQRQQLAHLSKDFTSICQHGRICYLGTPQTTDSIYNDLPGRGYSIRIWPGRYPTPTQLDNYGPHLAPMLAKRMLDDPSLQTGGGPLQDQGQVIDPVLLPEDSLTTKELDQGPAYFQLQHMLNTALMDADRYPLKPKQLITMDLNLEGAPGKIDWMPSPDNVVRFTGMPDKAELYRPFRISTEMYPYEGSFLYVDPAGGGENGDETVGTVTYFLHGYVFVVEQLALPGGFDVEMFEALSQLALRHMVNEIGVEQNYGNGAYAQMWRPVLLAAYKEKEHPGCPRIEDIHETGQKELRIIDSLEPIMARHRLIITDDVWRADVKQVQKYPVSKRTTFTLYNQMSKISRAPGALVHDDRLDSLAGSVRRWLDNLAIDEEKRMAQKVTNENMEFLQSWSDTTPQERQQGLKPLPKTVGSGRMGSSRRRPSQRRMRKRR